MLLQEPLLAKLWIFWNIENEFVLKHVILDIILIEKLNLTSIIGHYSVPEESLDNVDIENILDDNINNKSETVENKDLLSNILQESNS